MSPIVICIDFESYIAAVASMETLAINLPDMTDQLSVAIADFKRAHASYAMIDSQLHMPAFLRRQAE